MPTTLTHAVVGFGMAGLWPAEAKPPAFWLLSVVLAELPDIDVLAFRFGIPYGARFGHRGFCHSLACAAAVSLPVALAAAGPLQLTWWALWGYAFLLMAVHDVLDMATNGGLGIALLAPIDETRYFLPWRPLQCSPIGLGCFSRWGLRALLSEVVWVWLPLAVLLVVAWQGRSTGA